MENDLTAGHAMLHLVCGERFHFIPRCEGGLPLGIQRGQIRVLRFEPGAETSDCNGIKIVIERIRGNRGGVKGVESTRSRTRGAVDQLPQSDTQTGRLFSQLWVAPETRVETVRRRFSSELVPLSVN